MKKSILKDLGINLYDNKIDSLYLGNKSIMGKKENIICFTPIDGSKTVSFHNLEKKDLIKSIDTLHESYLLWREVPAPKRGLVVKKIGQLALERKEELAYLITLESGKIFEEALGEVQEFIDMCDFALGLSRQLYGLSIASERHRHKMIEQWHPLGVVGVITAFNFPMAVWAWNAMLAFICGNTIIWKPSSQTPLCAIACHELVNEALKEFPLLPQTLSAVSLCNASVAQEILTNTKVRLVSVTGSVSMGKKVAPIVANRLGRTLFELGGNNAMIITPTANLDLAIRAVVFSAVGTAGQRCTSLRRLFVHKKVFKKVQTALLKAYKSIEIGNPMKKESLMGPLVNEKAFNTMQKALKQAKKEDAKRIYGGERLKTLKGFYVKPALVKIKHEAAILQEETFAPILYLIEYESFDEVLSWHNDVPQGLSSSIFTNDVQEAELFTSSIGSDCGIANVNIGTSGAEIGGAFGGEKDTGGGRESGSDAWKNYMRRVTNTINYADDIPLSQGIHFDLL